MQSNVCRNLFFNIADALNTKNFNLMEFMIASSLEASLRTLYFQPITGSRKTDNWHLETSLKNFRQTYLKGSSTKEWRKVRKVCSEVAKCYWILRNKNAHPDWLQSTDPHESIKSKELFDHMVFLCKFYGYMILALAGYEDLKPNF
jgi:hypothetical protein